jgi:CRP-like cAMP-binding protein
MQEPSLFGVVGFVGVAIYLGSYLILQAGLIGGRTYIYAGLNLVGACCVLFSLQQNLNLSAASIGQIIWIVISVAGMLRLWIVTHRVRFSPEEQAFLATKLPGLSRESARRFLNTGLWVDAEPGQILAREGEPIDFLFYIASGRAAVSQNGHFLAHCGRDTLVGELTTLSGDPATATVVLDQPTRYFAIGAGQLQRLVRRDAELATALHRSFTGEARAKLVAANARQRRFEVGRAAIESASDGG